MLHNLIEMLVRAAELLAGLVVSYFRLIRFYASKSVALPSVEVIFLAIAF
jgi:hypothetical protein